jgi:hypothetical protein
MGIARNIARLVPNGSGELPTANLQNAAITTAKIADAAVVEADLANNIALPGTGAVTIVRGTTAQRPSSAEGLLRFNTTKKTIEGVLSTQWSRDWQPMTMAPCMYGFNSRDTTGVNGWKTIRVFEDFNCGINGSSVYNNSNGRITPNEEGWYLFVFGHGHTNGSHGNYRLNIYHDTFGDIAALWQPNSDRTTITAISYMNGSTHWVAPNVYHDNTNHPDDNGGRVIFFGAFRIMGADN